MKAATFDLCGRILWWAHLATLVAMIGATVAIAAARVRHGPSSYFEPLDLFAITIGVEVYLAFASGIAWITHYPDHSATSKNFLMIAVASALLAVLTGVIWIGLPKHL